MKVYILQIHLHMQEDDIYVFSTRKEAEEMVFEWYTQNDETYPPMEIREFETYLYNHGIGYFTIHEKEVLMNT